MGKSTPSPPPAPDPAATAAAQSAANVDTAVAQSYLNRINQNTPYGQVRYNQTGTVNVGGNDVPLWEQNVTLSPAQQQQLDKTNTLQNQALDLGSTLFGNVGGVVSQPFTLDGLPQIQGLDDFSADRARVENAILDRAAPQVARQEEALRTRLYNSGIREGSDAWKAAMDDFNRSQNDLTLGAIQQGGAEQSRLFGLEQAARQQGIQERSLERSQPINEYSTILGLGGNVQLPQFGMPSAGTIAPTDVMGPINMQYGNQMAGWQAQNAANQSLFGNLSGLGGALGAAAIMSDRKAKTDIERIGVLDNGLPVYRFRYKGELATRIGLMAQDVEKANPSAVIEIGGIKHVDYAKAAQTHSKVA